jgi:hypothetical protein
LKTEFKGKSGSRRALMAHLSPNLVLSNHVPEFHLRAVHLARQYSTFPAFAEALRKALHGKSRFHSLVHAEQHMQAVWTHVHGAGR